MDGKNNFINPELFKEIGKKTGREKTYNYEQINKYAILYSLRPQHAAIKFAQDLGINIKKFVSDDYYNAVAGKIPQPSISSIIIGKNITKVPKIKSSYPTINLDFSKIKNRELAKILERDLMELNWAIKSGTDNTCKTCMILSGSMAEALLLDRLTQDKGIKNRAVQAVSLSQNKPKDVNDLESWSLVNLISVSVILGLIHSDIETQIGQLKDWRNLVHPGKELKVTANKRMKISPERAENAIGFLKVLAHDIKY